MQYGTAALPASALNIGYSYESGAGRLNGLSAFGQDIAYGFETGFSLIKTLTSTSDPNYAVTRNWESDRDLLTSIETKWGASSKAMHYYKYDFLGRRVGEFKRGEVFDRYREDPTPAGVDGIVTTYAYDDRGQLAEVKNYLDASVFADPVPGTTPAVNGRAFGYHYDQQGNRTEETAGDGNFGVIANGHGADYSVNGLNQYRDPSAPFESRDVPGYVDIGVASTSGPVTVNGSPAAQQGEYFHREPNFDNAAQSRYETITITSGTGDVVGGEVFLAKDREQFLYDADGNLLRDGLWHYSWDAENRLV